MKTKLTIALLCVAAAAAVYAVTNVTINVPLPETKYTNLVQVASNQATSVESFLSNIVVREIEGQRLGMLIELWQKANPTQQQNALDALKAE